MTDRLSTAIRSPRVWAIACFVSAYAAVGASAPYLPIYYQSLGMPLDVIGLLGAVVALSTLFAAPAWGLLADRLQRTRLVLPAACVIAGGVAAALGLATEPTSGALLAVLFWLAYAGMGPLLDARALEIVAEDQNRYSRLRAWGSAAFVVSAVVVGVLVQSAGLRALFIVLVGALLVTAILALGLPTTRLRIDLPRFTGLEKLLRNRVLVAFFGTVLIVWTANSAISAFFSIQLTQIGASQSLIGVAWAIGAAVEIPLMIVFPQLTRRVGVEPLLLLGALLLVLRALTITLVHDPLLVTLTMLLHGGGYAFLLVGGVTYVAARAPSGAAATAQGVLAGIATGLAYAIGPGIGGIIASTYGLNAMFGVATIVCAVGMGGLVLALRLRPARVPAAQTAAGTPR